MTYGKPHIRLCRPLSHAPASLWGLFTSKESQRPVALAFMLHNLAKSKMFNRWRRRRCQACGDTGRTTDDRTCECAVDEQAW